MMKLSKALISFSAASALSAVFCLSCLGKEPVNITYKEPTLSADLAGVPLDDVLEHLSESQNIWFKVHKSVIDRKVSVQFTDLPLEKGLKRILTDLDYSLEFDSQGKPVGIVIVGEKAAGHAGTAGGRVAKSPPGPEDGPPEDVSDNFAEDEPAGPFGPVTITPEEREQFKVIRNVPPPGGYPEITEEEREQFQVERNVPPPGGPPTATEEDLEKFKVIRNAPPPGEGPFGPNP
jgi:hypothetical protein